MSEVYNIYFNENKEAFAYEIEDPICVITSDVWEQYAGTSKWDIIDGEFTDVSDTPEYQQEQADVRRADFESKFFYIEGYGWYRRQPKGYSSAIESLNTAFNSFAVMQQTGIQTFPANVFIFYQAPDFTKPEECTEEWLVEHQTKNKAMTALEFGAFYTTFANTWNSEEHE